jgi:serine/threonine protein kinase
MAADERYRKAIEIFQQAVRLEAGQRPPYLKRACLGDEALLQEVERMLASDPQADGSGKAAIQNPIAESLTAAYGAHDHNSPIGTTLHHRYLIQSLLGEGGIGRVYRAIDLQVNSRPVAVKLLRADQYESKDRKKDEWLKRKFLQEAEALSRVRHPGVVMVLDKGELSDGRPFLVMEWVEGRSLRDAMKPYGMDVEQVAKLVQQIGQALTAVHHQQVFHRDLKPENIMLQSLGDGEEHIKLIDFGIAKVKGSEVGPETSQAIVAGTLPYLAPEQILGHTISAVTDTYTLGIIVYEMLTGRLPFNPEAQDAYIRIQQLCKLQQAGVRVRPRDLRASLPEATEAAILKALSFDPAERHQRSKDFGEELAQTLLDRQTAKQEEARGSRQSLEEMKPEPAHVLFMDIIEYSKRPMSQQRQVVNQLQDIVRHAGTVKRAREDHQIVILFTGDGMALGFFGEPLLSLECAKEIARAMQSQYDFELRMGLHTGPVYRIEDINANKNIAGGGINLAQRVMDCGDARHILLSKTYADYMIQLGEWTPHLRDLGECQVKHGLKLHLFNFYDGEVGNPSIPKKLLSKAPPPAAHNWRRLYAALIILALIGGLLIWKLVSAYKSGPSTASSGVALQEVKPNFALGYSVVVQTFARGGPSGAPIAMSGETEGSIYFRNDDRIRFHFTSPESGYLYLLNEGPQPGPDGKPIYHVIFPSTEDHRASAQIEANQRRIVPREENPAIGFFGSTGAEKVWMIWSRMPVAELEEIKGLNNPTDGGRIMVTGQIERIQRFLSEHSWPRPLIERDEAGKRTNLSAAGDMIVHSMTLEHR